MKRTMILSTAAGLMLLFGVAVTASAQGTPTTTPAAPITCANGNWVDANGDGVCDSAPRDGSGQQFGRQGTGNGLGMGNGQGMINSRGMGQRQGMGNGQGANFVDQDKDGTCDNFVDADGDRVCDSCRGQQHSQRGGSRQGMGMGRGMHGGGHGMRSGMGPGVEK